MVSSRTRPASTRTSGHPETAPGLDALAEFVAAHVTRVPFENISKLHRRKTFGLTTLPDLRLFLDGIERFHFGGTCHSTNFHLYTLLASLG